MLHIRGRCFSHQKKLRGQALLEFALALPIFLMLVFGIIDLARYYFTEQSVSHTLREAGRYAVTGQLMTNSTYNAGSSNSFPYLARRASIIAAAQANNPAGLSIVANPTNYTASDTFTISSSTNFAGPYLTNADSGTGGEYVKLQLRIPFYFITPLLNQIYSSATGQPFTISGSLIMKDESFQTNAYSSTNATGASTNYWN